jgi:hypothetical protein
MFGVWMEQVSEVAFLQELIQRTVLTGLGVEAFVSEQVCGEEEFLRVEFSYAVSLYFQSVMERMVVLLLQFYLFYFLLEAFIYIHIIFS